MKVGLVGCGVISRHYVRASKQFPVLDICKCADINPAAAKALAEEFSIEAVSLDGIFKDPEIGIILNLTIPSAHTQIDMQALENGKHVYSEKPLGIDRDDAKKMLDFANKHRLRVGCAPDTILGGGQQTCRKLIDDNWVGDVIGGTAMLMQYGPQSEFFFQPGAGPLFDMGPYYITALVNLLGPVRKITAVSRKTFSQRIITRPERYGQVINVEVPTYNSAMLEFVNGALIDMIVAFGVWKHGHKPIELYGTEGSLQLPDPNTFGGPVNYCAPRDEFEPVPLTHGYFEPSRSIGLADMVTAIAEGRPHRCNAELALHVLDVMCSFYESSDREAAVEISSTCERPEPFNVGLRDGFLS